MTKAHESKREGPVTTGYRCGIHGSSGPQDRLGPCPACDHREPRDRDREWTDRYRAAIEQAVGDLRNNIEPRAVAADLERALPEHVTPIQTDGASDPVIVVGENDRWPAGVSDGLDLPCADCGEIPAFDYHVTDPFWRRWVPEKPARLSVVCLPCLDRRCNGAGLAAALVRVQWIGTGHTVVLRPAARFEYGRKAS